MRGRCLNPNHPSYARYGGRGIRPCARWDDFAAFLADMGERPPGMSLERIDNALGYEPGNCRWATATEQANNTRSNRIIPVAGEEMSVAAAARAIGMPRSRLASRLDAGWDVQRAITQSSRRHA